MDVRNVRIEGKFDSVPVGDGEHWTTQTPLWIRWEWRADGALPWRDESLYIADGYRWDGASRPNVVGWVIPRGGVFLLASLVHDFCFGERPFLSGGERISRKLTDLLYLELMGNLAAERVTDGWKAPAQVQLAKVMYRAVRWFGSPVWDKHDGEFRRA